MKRWSQELEKITTSTIASKGSPDQKRYSKEREDLVKKILSYLSTQSWALVTPENPIEIHLFDPRTDTTVPLIPPPVTAGAEAMAGWYRALVNSRVKPKSSESGDIRILSGRPRMNIDFDVPGAHLVDWGAGVVVVAPRPVVGGTFDETLSMGLKKQSVRRGWTRLVLTDLYPFEDETVWDRLKDLIKTTGNKSGLDPLVAEEVTRMLVEGTDLYGISDPRIVLGRSGKPPLVDNFDFETPHSIVSMKKNKDGLNKYLKAFSPISISSQLKDSPLMGEEVLVDDPDAPGRSILTPESVWRISCDGIEGTEIVRFLGHPAQVTEWKDADRSRPRGFGAAKKTKRICFTTWSRGYNGWDSCIMVETVNEMSKSEKMMITIDQPSEGMNPKGKQSQKILMHGPRQKAT
jgi:hypothetical protein